MKPILTKLALALIASSAFTGSVRAQQAPTILGKTDIQALLEAAPGLPNSTTEAATRAYGPDIRMHEMPIQLDPLYDPFFKRAAAAHNQLKEAMGARAKGMPGKATVEKQAKAQVNNNPIVAGMGGIDNIQQMTPEQRKQAALQSVGNFQEHLVTGGGRNSASMQAMMQRVMSDPEYRARFMKMSEQEKEAELRKNMGTVAPQTAEEHQKAQQPMRAGNEVNTVMAIRKELNQMIEQIGKIDADFARLDQAITNAPGSHDQIGREIGAKIAKVPIVDLGEYGHDRDPVQEMALLREQATRDRGRAAWELNQRTALHTWRKAQYKRLAAEYETWLKQNLGRINTSMADPLRNTNTELAVLGYEDGLIGLSETLAKYTEETTKDAARYERQYQDKTSNAVSARLSRPTKAGK